MGKVVIMDHPLVKHKLGVIRNKDTEAKVFRETIGEIAVMIFYEASRDLELKEVDIETPVSPAKVEQLAGDRLCIVPIIRAGIGMADGITKLLPIAKVGHIGMYRDEETLKPVEYLYKMPPDIANRDVFIVDPMLATGGSAIAAIDRVKKSRAKSIRFLCTIAAPEGLKALQEAHPDVDIYIGAVDEKLNEHGYIVPGLGDAGDRIFGTF